MRGEARASVQLRPFQAADHVALEQALRAVWGSNDDAIAYYRYGEATNEADRYLLTLVAEQDEQFVGMGSVWTNRFHPHSAYIGINVTPAFQKRGIGTALWKHLIAECAPCQRLPLQTATDEHQQRARRFLQERGFHEVKRTYQPTLNLQALDVPKLDQHAARVAQAGYIIYTLAALAHDSKRNDHIVDLFVQLYTTTHRVNPPVGRTSALWHDAVFGTFIEDAFFVALKHGEYVALSSLRPHRIPHWLWLDFRGVAEQHRAHETELILALTQQELIYALQHGVTTLQAEIDTDDPWAMTLLQHLPFSTSSAWITFRKGGT